MAELFLFGTYDKQRRDRELLKKALGAQPNKDQYMQSASEIGDAMALAEIAQTLEKLVDQKAMTYPIETVIALRPLVEALPGVKMEWVEIAFPSDSFPIRALEDFLPACQRAINDYHFIAIEQEKDRWPRK